MPGIDVPTVTGSSDGGDPVRTYAYSRLPGPSGRYVQWSNDRTCVSVVQRYEERGDAERLDSRGRRRVVRGVRWATRVLGDDELVAAGRDEHGRLLGCRVGEDVSVWDRDPDASGLTTMGAALVRAAAASTREVGP